tara:strand:- start:144 stop:368 length:225 start_codon:yes stop_codon:yes gene_type:complete
MKLTETRIRQIIAEEVAIMREADGEEIMKAITDVPKAAEAIATKIRSEIEKLAEPSGLDPLVLSQAVAALLTAK